MLQNKFFDGMFISRYNFRSSHHKHAFTCRAIPAFLNHCCRSLKHWYRPNWAIQAFFFFSFFNFGGFQRQPRNDIIDLVKLQWHFCKLPQKKKKKKKEENQCFLQCPQVSCIQKHVNASIIKISACFSVLYII